MEAGLPNITGYIQYGGAVGLAATTTEASGAFYANVEKGKKLTFEEGISYGISFNASRCSSIYGNSSTVQPPSLTAIYAIKY